MRAPLKLGNEIVASAFPGSLECDGVDGPVGQNDGRDAEHICFGSRTRRHFPGESPVRTFLPPPDVEAPS